MNNRKRKLLTDSVALFARYLQHEYLANGLHNIEGQHVIYDRMTVDFILEANPRGVLNAGPIAKFTERYCYLVPIESKIILNFLTGYTSFYYFYDALITFILEVEQTNNVINARLQTNEERLEELAKVNKTSDNIIIVGGREVRDRQLALRSSTLAEVKAREFIYPFDLTARDVMNLLSFEQPRAGLISKLVMQVPDDIISIYDYYMWLKKELVRRGILIQKVGQRLSIYDNTLLNYDLPPSLIPLLQLDTTNRGLGFEHLTYEENTIIQDSINDLYMQGLEGTEDNKRQLDSQLLTLDSYKSTFAVSLYDLGIGLTMKRTANAEQKYLNKTTQADLQHHIQKVLVQQQGCTSVRFTRGTKTPNTLLHKVRLKGFLFEVEAVLDENILNTITY